VRRDVRDGGHSDADAVQLSKGPPRRGLAAGHGARVLPRRSGPLRRVWPRRAGRRGVVHPASASSGLNLLGASQHLSTAVWGLFLIAVMVLRWVGANYGGAV